MQKRLLEKSFSGTVFRQPIIQTAHGVLLLGDRYILQLRDNKPNIAAPGQWSLFGGIKEANETPLEAMSREVYEELLIRPAEFRYLWFTDYFAIFEAEVIRTYFFVSDVTSVWSNHHLQEGQEAKDFRFEEMDSLEIPQVMRQTIVRLHRQKIMPDFLRSILRTT